MLYIKNLAKKIQNNPVALIVILTLTIFGAASMGLTGFRVLKYCAKKVLYYNQPEVRDEFIYLSSDMAEETEKLIVYTNGSISLGKYPYHMLTSWKLKEGDEWNRESEIKDYSWELMNGYLPILVTKHEYQNLFFESKVFCQAAKTDKPTLGFKTFTVKNGGKRPVQIYFKTDIIYKSRRQYIPQPYEQGYDMGYSSHEHIKGEFAKLGSGGVLCSSKFSEQVLTIKPGEVFSVDYQILLPTDSLDRNYFIGWEYISKELLNTKSYWLSKLHDFSSKFPESENKRLMLSSLMHILMAAGSDVIKPTAFYKTPFIRDGALITHVLNIAGFHKIAKRQIEYFLEHPWASAFGPEADAPGELVWMVADYVRHSGDTEYLRKNWQKIDKTGEVIISICNTNTSYGLNGATVAHREGNIVFGWMDSKMRPVFCNTWLLAGLREAAYLANLLGKKAAYKKYNKAYEAYYASFISYCKENIDFLKSQERVFISGLYPTQVFTKDQDFVKKLYSERWPLCNAWEAGEWPYFEFAQANAYLILGEVEKSEVILEAIKKKYPQYRFSVFYEGVKERFMPHLWGAAEAFCFYYRRENTALNNKK